MAAIIKHPMRIPPMIPPTIPPIAPPLRDLELEGVDVDVALISV